MEQHALKIVNNCLTANIYSYMETSGGQSYNLYLNVVHLLTPVLIGHLWQLMYCSIKKKKKKVINQCNVLELTFDSVKNAT
jgi:hypothetical protein